MLVSVGMNMLRLSGRGIWLVRVLFIGRMWRLCLNRMMGIILSKRLKGQCGVLLQVVTISPTCALLGRRFWLILGFVRYRRSPSFHLLVQQVANKRNRMTSTMFIILVSLRTAALRPSLLQHKLPEFGPHLQALLSSWIGVMPQKSPSIQQSIRLIGEIENLIRDSL